jgi:hypothetical protein
MVRKPSNKRREPKALPKAPRKRPEDTTVEIPLDFEDAVRAFLKTPPPVTGGRVKKPSKR